MNKRLGLIIRSVPRSVHPPAETTRGRALSRNERRRAQTRTRLLAAARKLFAAQGPDAYVALTNSTAFSPTDAMPLSRPAKALMAVESALSVTTVPIVAARAVNVLK
jgi:hypothetical protein